MPAGFNYQINRITDLNFLAHLFLSGDDDDLKIGNYIGDFVKGNQLKKFPERIQKGIVMHRRIDEFTDNHPVVLQSKLRLRPKYRHYSPVIVDMFYDHYLAANWSDYSSHDLKGYTTGFYKMARLRSDEFPERVIDLLNHMSATDWLYHYKEIEGIGRALSGMARRTKFDSGMENSVEDLIEGYDNFLQEFQSFFPELIEYCNHD